MPGLEGTVDVPLAGKVSKKAAAGGLLVTGTLGGVYYYRKRKSGGSAAASASGTGTAGAYPPDGTTGNPQDLYSTDPATGLTYGDELSGAGAGAAGGALGSGAASGLYYDPATGAYDLTSPYGTGGTGVSQGNPATPGGPPFASNEAWSNWAIQELVALDPNIDTGALTNALGVYLQGDPVTPAQKTLVFDALAVAGDPPVAGAGGYPPKVKTAPTTNHTTETVPEVVGDRVENAVSAIQAAGLKASFGTRKPGVPYKVSAQSPAAGHRVAEGSTVHLTIKAETGPKPQGPGPNPHNAHGSGSGPPQR